MSNFKYYVNNAVIPLLAVNIFMFVLQLILGDNFTANFLLLSEDVLQRPWILITHMFLHSTGSPFHLLFNMYVLYSFGPLLEQKIGTKRFLLAYFTCGIIAAVFSSMFYAASLGASGAIMGMLGVLIILMPNLRLLFFFAIPMSLRTAAIFIVLIDVVGVVNPGGNVANIAHLAGLGSGLLFGLYWNKRKKEFHKRFSKKTELDKDDIDEYLKTGRM